MRRLVVVALVLPLAAGSGLARNAAYPLTSDIVAVDLAGRAVNLTRNAALNLAPSATRDGRIVFLSSRDQADALYVMDASGANVRKLADADINNDGDWLKRGDYTQPSWSSNGKTIAFDSMFDAGGPSCSHLCVNWRVSLVDPVGREPVDVARGAKAPTLSPDGSRIAYLSGIDAYGDAGGITIARLDGSGSVQVSAVSTSDGVAPAWSPNGRMLAFEVSSDQGTPQVYVVGADGRHKRRLGPGRNPTWSPDGRRLALVYDNRLIVVGVDGRGRHRLSRKAELVFSATWSPKSGALAVVAASGADLRLETIGADGKRVRLLAREPASATILGPPVWTTNGKRILIAVAR